MGFKYRWYYIIAYFLGLILSLGLVWFYIFGFGITTGIEPSPFLNSWSTSTIMSIFDICILAAGSLQILSLIIGLIFTFKKNKSIKSIGAKINLLFYFLAMLLIIATYTLINYFIFPNTFLYKDFIDHFKTLMVKYYLTPMFIGIYALVVLILLLIGLKIQTFHVKKWIEKIRKNNGEVNTSKSKHKTKIENNLNFPNNDRFPNPEVKNEKSQTILYNSQPIVLGSLGNLKDNPSTINYNGALPSATPAVTAAATTSAVIPPNLVNNPSTSNPKDIKLNDITSIMAPIIKKVVNNAEDVQSASLVYNSVLLEKIISEDNSKISEAQGLTRKLAETKELKKRQQILFAIYKACLNNDYLTVELKNAILERMNNRIKDPIEKDEFNTDIRNGVDIIWNSDKDSFRTLMYNWIKLMESKKK